MASAAEKKKWLKEHLIYERDMFRHTYRKVCELSQSLDRFAFYESFAVHARNLYSFLTNDEDPRNYRAREFIDGFESDGGELHGKIQRMNTQVQHMGKSRAGDDDPDKKIKTGDCETVARWIEEHMQRFLSQLGEPYKQVWLDRGAKMQTEPMLSIPRPRFRDTASASVTMTSTIFPALVTKIE